MVITILAVAFILTVLVYAWALCRASAQAEEMEARLMELEEQTGGLRVQD